MKLVYSAGIAASIALAIALSGCSAAPSPEPVASRSPSPTPSAQPTTEPSSAATGRVVISATSFAVVAPDGSVQSWSYGDGTPNGSEISALTQLFGSSPVIGHDSNVCYADRSEPCERSTASWDGFVLGWYLDQPDGTRITTTTAAVGDVAITSVGGHSVGDDFASLDESGAVLLYGSPEGDEMAMGVGEVHPPNTMDAFSYYVRLVGRSPFDKVLSISAPWNNYGV